MILLALVGVCSGLLAPIASAEPARGAVFSGTGVWIDIWDALEKTLDKVVATAVQRGVPVIYVETANFGSKVDVVNPGTLKDLVRLANVFLLDENIGHTLECKWTVIDNNRYAFAA